MMCGQAMCVTGEKRHSKANGSGARSSLEEEEGLFSPPISLCDSSNVAEKADEAVMALWRGRKKTALLSQPSALFPEKGIQARWAEKDVWLERKPSNLTKQENICTMV